MTLKDRKKLTNREQEVYDLVLKGLAYIDIARRLVIEECTVVTHILHIYEKLDCHSRIDLMVRRINQLEETIEEMKRTKK